MIRQPMLPLLTRHELRQLESQALIHSPAPDLMARAGQASAHWILQHCPPHLPVVLLLGPGNNGGDGWVCAWHLHQGARTLVLACRDPDASLAPAAQTARSELLKHGVRATAELSNLAPTSIVVDALFGIGGRPALPEPYAGWVRQANAASALRIALDLPSGLDSDSGVATQPCFHAHHTLTFLAHKPGLHTADGPDQCGEVQCFELDVVSPAAPGQLLELRDLQPRLPHRHRNTHKGEWGGVAVLGGASGMQGAALLAAHSALLCGAGRVWVSLLSDNNATRTHLGPLELMELEPAALMSHPALDVLVVGPGLGTTPSAQRLLETVVHFPGPMVWDADALNLVSTSTILGQLVRQRSAPTILTPHPGEARRLLGLAPAERVLAALTLAKRFNSIVILKGCGSVVAEPTGRWWINPSGNPTLAAPGMGDVLAGTIAALLGQKMPALWAALAGVYYHGAAADQARQQGLGPIGLGAGELIPLIRDQLNRQLASHPAGCAFHPSPFAL